MLSSRCLERTSIVGSFLIPAGEGRGSAAANTSDYALFLSG